MIAEAGHCKGNSLRKFRLCNLAYKLLAFRIEIHPGLQKYTIPVAIKGVAPTRLAFTIFGKSASCGAAW
jgi:hypothetical protein